MSQQHIWNSKSLLGYARSLRGSGVAPGDVEKLKSWQEAVLTRLREIVALVPQLQEGFGTSEFQPAAGSLEQGDEQIPGLTAEFEKLQQKYCGVSNAVIQAKQQAGVLVR